MQCTGQHTDVVCRQRCCSRKTSPSPTLSTIAVTQPHAAYAAFIHGYVHKICFLCRICPNVKHSLQSVDKSIRCRFIPAITGSNHPNKFMRDLLALPTHWGNGPGQPSYTSLNQIQIFMTCFRPTEECHIGARRALHIALLGGPSGCKEGCPQRKQGKD